MTIAKFNFFHQLVAFDRFFWMSRNFFDAANPVVTSL
jgi:hypothetical protein